MNELNTESKIAIIVISITIVVILVVLYVTGSFSEIFNNYKKNSIMKCTSSDVEGSINYKNINCVATDEDGKSYTISYPEFKDKSFAIKAINKELKDKYKRAIDSIEFHEDKDSDKLKIYLFNELNYKVTTFNDYLFIIDVSNTLLDNGYRYDYVYNVNIVNLKNMSRVSQEDFYRSINITSNFSSNLKRLVIDIFYRKFNYNYEYATVRNEKLDDFYDNLSSSNINTFYYDASGRLSFILYLYDINKAKEVPYFFKVSSNGEVTYSEVFS